MAKIYISSTFADLQEVRARAYAQLRKSRHDVISMEDYNASGRRPLAKCLADVRDADIYLGIFGWRYGFVPEEDNPDRHSITEREYREAVAAGKEIVTFLVDEAAAWPPPLMDSHTGENGAGARIKAFRAHVSTVHVRGTFATADELAAHLSPAIEEACARLAPASPAQLDNIATLTSEELQNLAARFGIDRPFDTPDGELRRLLTLKADEYRALKSEVDAIDDGLKRLSNLKAAAQDAIARVDLEEVEELLSRVQEVELEEAAKTAELRANNALLRGRVDQAYRLFCAAADSFAAVDPLEPARRRIRGAHAAFPALYFHGLRYGGDALERAAQLISAVLTPELREEDPDLWAGGQNNLGIALADHGIRTGGAEGAALLSEGVEAYRAALEIRTRAADPVKWAQTQNNLGTALQDLGTITGGAEGTALLAEAVTAYRAALEVHTRADRAADWAQTQNNLGTALTEQGKHTAGEKGKALLAEAVAAYRASLEVRTRADRQVQWAMTQNNLGAALQVQGTRTGGVEGTDLLAAAITAFRSALEVRTLADHPVDWATTQYNLALAKLDRANHAATRDPTPHLEAALAAVEAALEVFDPEYLSHNREKATRLRDEIRSELDKLS